MKTASRMSQKGPIAKRVIVDLKKQSKRKVVDSGQLRRAKIEGKNLLGSIISREKLDQSDTLVESISAPGASRPTIPC